MKKTISPLAVASLVFVAAACSSSSSTGGSSANTAGEQCTRVMNAFCTHAVNDCHLTGTVSDCVMAGVNACCATKCSDAAISTDSSLDPCIMAMQTLSCTDVSTGNAPLVCHGVVKYMSYEPGVELQSIGAQISSRP
jgi:hypothetical protein